MSGFVRGLTKVRERARSRRREGLTLHWLDGSLTQHRKSSPSRTRSLLRCLETFERRGVEIRHLTQIAKDFKRFQVPATAVEKGAWGVAALESTRQARRELQDSIALKRDRWISRNRYYYGRIKRLLRFIIEPQKRVLEVRCQTGDLLAAVEPSFGVGVEISQKLVDVARNNHPDLNFICVDPEDLVTGEKFDYVIVGHIFDTVDILAALNRIRDQCAQHTRILIINYNQLWEPVLELASSLGLRSRTG